MEEDIKYQINVDVVDNPVATSEENQKIFRVFHPRTVDDEGVVEEIMNINPGYERETVRSIYQFSMRILKSLLVSGARVKTSLFDASIQSRGAANGMQWDDNQNSLYVQFKQSAELREAISNNIVCVQGAKQSTITLHNCFNVSTQTYGFTATIGRNFILKGKFIKLVGTHPSVGVTLTAADGTVTRIGRGLITTNTPTQLNLLIPEILSPGEYTLTVTTQYSTSRLLKHPRSVSHSLQVLPCTQPDEP